MVINACSRRYPAALGLAAALLAGRLTLFPGEAPATLARLRAEHPEAPLLTDSLLADSLLAGPLAPPPASPAPIPAGRPALVVFTSGSTGTPAATVKSWGELVARSHAAARRFGWGAPGTRSLVATVPPGHMYGLETSVLLPLHIAVTVWCGPAFYPADIETALAALPAPRLLVTTPLHLRATLAAGLATRPERVISATAPLAPSLAAAAEAAWGAEIHEILGASELGSFASRRPSRGPAWQLYDGLILTPLPAATAPGFLLHAPAAPPRRLHDRLVPAGDPRHFLLEGRPQDLIKRGGRRTSLTALAHAALAIEGVTDAAFLAPPDLETNPAARLAAFLVAPGHDRETLRAALRAAIEPVFLPRPLLLLDTLPRDRLGKLRHESLVALLARHARPATPMPV